MSNEREMGGEQYQDSQSKIALTAARLLHPLRSGNPTEGTLLIQGLGQMI